MIFTNMDRYADEMNSTGELKTAFVSPIMPDESLPLPSGLDADVESSTAEHLDQPFLELDEFSGENICYSYGSTEDFCMCERCEHWTRRKRNG